MKYIALALVCSGCASTPTTDNFNRPFEAWVPADVRHFVIDAQACIHFSGEGPTGEPERDRFLERMIKKTCIHLDEREAVLTNRYGASEQVKVLIAKIWRQ